MQSKSTEQWASAQGRHAVNFVRKTSDHPYVLAMLVSQNIIHVLIVGIGILRRRHGGSTPCFASTPILRVIIVRLSGHSTVCVEGHGKAVEIDGSLKYNVV